MADAVGCLRRGRARPRVRPRVRLAGARGPPGAVPRRDAGGQAARRRARARVRARCVRSPPTGCRRSGACCSPGRATRGRAPTRSRAGSPRSAPTRSRPRSARDSGASPATRSRGARSRAGRAAASRSPASSRRSAGRSSPPRRSRRRGALPWTSLPGLATAGVVRGLRRQRAGGAAPAKGPLRDVRAGRRDGDVPRERAGPPPRPARVPRQRRGQRRERRAGRRPGRLAAQIGTRAREPSYTRPAVAPPETVLFDLDGTLIDSFEGLTRSYAHALSALGRTPPPPEGLRDCIGPPLRRNFARLLGTDDPVLLEAAVAHFRERYSAVGWTECRALRRRAGDGRRGPRARRARLRRDGQAADVHRPHPRARGPRDARRRRLRAPARRLDGRQAHPAAATRWRRPGSTRAARPWSATATTTCARRSRTASCPSASRGATGRARS